MIRLPTDEEAHMLRRLTQGVLPDREFPVTILHSLRSLGWIYPTHAHHSSWYYAINNSGMVALQRYDEKGG